MALTNSRFNSSGVVYRASGYLSGTYTAATVTSAPTDASAGTVIAAGVMTISLGFTPKHFKIRNATDRLDQEWHQGMNSGDFVETAAAGDKTLETDDKVVVDTTANTVTVTFDGGAATDNDTVVWVAEG